MNREQAREIARKAFLKWQNEGEIGWGADAISDALHAAYEAERAAPVDARLASIKETARGLFASRRVVLVNSAFDQAEHFEETFERRYGGKP